MVVGGVDVEEDFGLGVLVLNLGLGWVGDEVDFGAGLDLGLELRLDLRLDLGLDLRLDLRLDMRLDLRLGLVIVVHSLIHGLCHCLVHGRIVVFHFVYGCSYSSKGWMVED